MGYPQVGDARIISGCRPHRKGTPSPAGSHHHPPTDNDVAGVTALSPHPPLAEPPMTEPLRDEPQAASTGGASRWHTSLTLLDRVRGNDATAWQRLVHLYSPLVYYWCSRAGVRAHDAE